MTTATANPTDQAILKSLGTLLESVSDPSTFFTPIRTEIVQRAVKANPDVWKNIKGQESVKRILTVAAVQAHSVLLIGPPGVGKGMLAEAARQVGVRATPFEIPIEIHSHRGKLNKFDRDVTKAMAEHDIHAEVPAVPSRTLLSPQYGTTLEYTQKHLSQVKLMPACTADGLGDEAKSLLNAFIRELGVAARTVPMIMEIARSIASLEDARAIESQHVAEACQYRLDRGQYAHHAMIVMQDRVLKAATKGNS